MFLSPTQCLEETAQHPQPSHSQSQLRERAFVRLFLVDKRQTVSAQLVVGTKYCVSEKPPAPPTPPCLSFCPATMDGDAYDPARSTINAYGMTCGYKDPKKEPGAMQRSCSYDLGRYSLHVESRRQLTGSTDAHQVRRLDRYDAHRSLSPAPTASRDLQRRSSGSEAVLRMPG